MSANIPIGKLSFTVFGYGYNSDRADSGSGMKESIPLPFGASYAEFDPTGQFCWIKRDSSGSGLYKYDTRNWELVDQGEIPTNLQYLYKPKNSENGYAIAFPFTVSSGDAYLFDLTTNEIINSGAASTLISGKYDCIDAGNGIYRFCPQSGSSEIINIQSLDTDDFSVSKTADISQRAGVGFIDTDSIYAYYPREWFYQLGYVASYNVSGGQDWYQQATEDDRGFNNVSLHGFTRDGKIYVPTNVNGTWKIGEYDGMSQVNFLAPNYVRTFGNFGNEKIEIGQNGYFAVYSGDRNLVAFPVTDKGLYISDFNDVYEIIDYADAYYYPLAITDGMVLCAKAPKPSGALSLEVFEF